MAAQVIAHKYIPRQQFMPFHERSQRFAVLVCHRRAGKTVAVIADLITRAMRTAKKNAFYAYLCPFAKQAKQVSWMYFVQQLQDIPGVKIHTSANTITLPNGARIMVAGADNADALRGLYFDGVILDEFGDMEGRVWSEVVRPALMDRKGWAVFIGTPRGKNKFYEMAERAQGRTPDGKPVVNAVPWFYLTLRADTSGILAPQELIDSRQDMDENEYAREMLVDFNATVRGAYYGDHIIKLAKQGSIRDVPYDRSYPVSLAMDIGYADATAIWFWQVIAGQVRFIDYWEASGHDAEEVVAILQMRYDTYETWWLPHDANHSTFRSKKSVIDTLREFNAPARLVPNLSLLHGIDAVRKTLRTYPLAFDGVKTTQGISALKNYSRKYDTEAKVFSNTPKHDQYSHGADAFRYACLVINHETIENSKEEARRQLAAQQAQLDGERSRYTFDQAWKDHDRQMAQQRADGRGRI